jgi:hypothetical protein
LRPRRLALVAACGAALLVPASAPAVVTEPRAVNLDGDSDLEQVIPEEVELGRRLVVRDTCAGAPYTTVISSEQEAVVTLRISNFADITPRPEIFFDMRSGAAARVGQIGIVSWEEGASLGACSAPRALFKYPAKRTRGRLPRKAKAVSTFDATLRDVSKRHAGKELRLTEFYVDGNDPLCCASYRRVTWFGYSAGRDLYVRFKTRLKRIRK